MSNVVTFFAMVRNDIQGNHVAVRPTFDVCVNTSGKPCILFNNIFIVFIIINRW